jgi:quercetin dioxygenase-like cupin family protein
VKYSPSLRQVLSFAAGWVAAALPLMADSSSAPHLLGTTYYNWNALVPSPTPVGYRYPLIDSATTTFQRMTAHITVLNPGAPVQAARSHPQEEVILVKEGTLDVMLHGKTTRAGPGSLIFLAANVMHNVTNVGTAPATYYVFDVYTRATASLRPEPADDWAAAGQLRSTVIDCERLPVKPTKQGAHKDVLEGPTVTYRQFHCHMTTLNPGAGTALLTDPADEIIVVQSGYIESFMKGVTVRMGPGSFYFQAAGDVHSSKNIGNTPATYVVLKWVVTSP